MVIIQEKDMKKSDIKMSAGLYDYILASSLREHALLRALREETALDAHAIMQIPPEQGQFMALLVKIMGARKTLEIGTYTGYSTLSVALALPHDGRIVACDINTEWTDIGRRYWRQAGVEEKVDLRIGPALETLDRLLQQGEEGSFDFAFIDADKTNYDGYYEKTLSLMRAGGVIAIDNVLLFGSVVDPEVLDPKLRARISAASIQAMRALNSKLKDDPRVDISLLPIADGLTLARKK